jgi:hypothetical protein
LATSVSRARNRALDAVAHRRNLAADGLADRHHGVACGCFRIREAHRDLRHRLRDHAQFLAAPGEAREEIEQQHRREEQRREAGDDKYAAGALADRSLQRRPEGGREKRTADQPNGAEQRRERIDAARGPALLDRLQHLTDGFAVVIGGAARGHARLLHRVEHRPLGRARAHVESGFVECRRWRRRDLVAGGSATAVRIGVAADIQGFLNGRKRNFGRVFDLFGIVRHVSLSPLLLRVPVGLCASATRTKVQPAPCNAA